MKVLIVDDESIVRRSLLRAFKSKGHTVIEAEDGQQGVEMWRQESPDCVLLDVLMPKLTGPQVLREMGDQRSGKVILISAFSGEDSFETAAQVGADKFIAKPFSDVFEVVRAAEELHGG